MGRNRQKNTTENLEYSDKPDSGPTSVTIPVVVGEMATAKMMMKLASMKMNSLYQGQENFTASVFLKPVNKDTATKNTS